MGFIALKQDIYDLLVDKLPSDVLVVPSQHQIIGKRLKEDVSKYISFHIGSGEFPSNLNPISSYEFIHDVTITFYVVVSVGSTKLSEDVLTMTVEDRDEEIANIVNGENRADDEWNKLFSELHSVLMSPLNLSLGGARGKQ